MHFFMLWTFLSFNAAISASKVCIGSRFHVSNVHFLASVKSRYIIRPSGDQPCQLFRNQGVEFDIPSSSGVCLNGKYNQIFISADTDDDRFSMDTGSFFSVESFVIANMRSFLVGRNSTIEAKSFAEVSASGIIEIWDNSRVTLNTSAELRMGVNTRLLVGNRVTLIVGPHSLLRMHENSLLEVESFGKPGSLILGKNVVLTVTENTHCIVSGEAVKVKEEKNVIWTNETDTGDVRCSNRFPLNGTASTELQQEHF